MSGSHHGGDGGGWLGKKRPRKHPGLQPCFIDKWSTPIGKGLDSHMTGRAGLDINLASPWVVSAAAGPRCVPLLSHTMGWPWALCPWALGIGKGPYAHGSWALGKEATARTVRVSGLKGADRGPLLWPWVGGWGAVPDPAVSEALQACNSGSAQVTPALSPAMAPPFTEPTRQCSYKSLPLPHPFSPTLLFSRGPVPPASFPQAVLAVSEWSSPLLP